MPSANHFGLGDDVSKVDITEKQDGGVLKQIKTKAPDESTFYNLNFNIRILQRTFCPGCKPFSGDKVSVHYVGTLEDGTKFDSSRDRGQYFKFDLGKGQVIKGWDVGVASMAKGETAVFTIRSDYGYGDTGSPPKIPGGATLVFEVELFEFGGEDVTKAQDGGVVKRVLEKGEGLDHPNDGAMVEVTVKGKLNGKVFDERSTKFTIGEGPESVRTRHSL